MLLLDYAHGNWMQQNQAWSKRHISIFKGVAHHIFQSIEKILNWKPIPIHFQQCERSELRLQVKNAKMVNFCEFLKIWKCGRTVLPDRSILKRQKSWWKTPKSNILMRHFGQFSNNLRQVKSNRTKNGRKCQRNFWVFLLHKSCLIYEVDFCIWNGTDFCHWHKNLWFAIYFEYARASAS